MTDNIRANVHTTDADREDERSSLQRRLLLLPFCVAVFSLSALFYYHLRFDDTVIESPLQVTYAAIYRTFGFAPSFVFFLLLLIWTSIWFFAGKIERPGTRLVRLLATTVMLGVFLNVGESSVGIPPPPHQGELGAFLASRMVAAFGYYPSLALVLVVTLGALLLATDFLFSETFERLSARSRRSQTEAAAEADAGVEAEVTDHLKGLAATGSSPLPASAAATTGIDVMVAADDDLEAGVDAANAEVGVVDDIAAEVREFGEAEIDVEPVIEPPTSLSRPSRRRSYYERRYEEPPAVAEPEVEPEVTPEVWLPSAAEAQEIDNPESEEEILLASAEADADAEIDAEESFVIDPVDEHGATVEIESAPAADAFADAAIEPAQLPEPGPDFGPEREPEPDEEPVQRDEPLFAIPRPPETETAAPGERESATGEAPTRQQGLFPTEINEELITEAREVVLETRRVSAALLRRRLRIGYDEAREVLAALSARGIVELDADASHGRVVE